MSGAVYSYVDGNPLNLVDPSGLLRFRNPFRWNPLPEMMQGIRDGTRLATNAVHDFVSSPFNVGWTAAGFFIVRPLAVAALAVAGITTGPALLIALGVATVTWFVAGRIVKRLILDECENRWA